MIQIRKSDERGHFDFGWLNTFHSFSFGDYYDPEFMGFRSLRVINEDFVQPGEGFPTHGHRDMEIVTYILEGELEHKDSMGTGSVIRPGEIQKMSAGKGVKHSEFNHSKKDRVHLLQIWIVPERTGITPNYEQKKISAESMDGKLLLIGSPEGSEQGVKIYQDMKLYAARLAQGKSLDYKLSEQRHAWVQVARGSLTVNGTKLAAGDGAAVSSEKNLKIAAEEAAEFLLFDLA